MSRRLTLLAAALAATACSKTGTKAPPSLSEPILVADAPVGQVVPDRPLDTNAPALAVGFDGTNYLVVWTQPNGQGDDIYGARVSGSGQLLDPQGFAISAAPSDQQAPAVAFDGTNWLVAWQDHRSGQYMNVYVARVSSAGQVLDPGGIALAPQAPYHQLDPAIAFDGTNYLVVWADHRGQTKYQIYGARVSPAGTVVDPGGFAIGSSSSQQLTPALAFDGTNYLAVWQDQRNDSCDIYGARVTPAGAVLDPIGFAVSSAAGTQSAPTAAFDGTNTLVAWQDQRGSVDADVYAARVSPAGAVLDSSGIAVAVLGGNQRSPAAVFDGADVLVVWEDGRSGTQYDVYGARLDPTGTVLEPAGFKFAGATAGQSVALASDKAGRGLVAYDAVDASGAWRLRARTFGDWAKLTVGKAGKGGGSVTSAPAGIDCGATCSAQFDTPTSVTLTATADGNSVFGGWSGDCAGMAACTLTVDAAKNVVATFLPLYPVTVALAGATGTVTSSPAGISCGVTCSSRWVEGTSVLLAPKGTPGSSVFGGWSGDCTGTDPCALTLDAPKAATASFLAAFTLTMNLTGTGRGTLAVPAGACVGATCGVDVVAGTTQMVTATPDAASVLKSLTGCSLVSPTTCMVGMTSAKSVSARFEPSTYALNLSTTGTGVGTISGPALSCTTGIAGGCSTPIDNPPYTASYNSVPLTAAPAAGSVFKSWTGCWADAANPAACSVVMSGAKSVSVRFEASTIPLTVRTSGTGSGTVTGVPGLSCTTGSTANCTVPVDNPNNTSSYGSVTLTAAPLSGSVFKSWIGCSSDPANPASCSVIVSRATTVTARFEPATFALTLTPTGTPGGTITGAGLACSTGSAVGCSGPVDNPANSSSYNTITLTATPLAGAVFKSWIGCAPDAINPASCTVYVNGAKSVSAKFEPSTYPLTAAPGGTGVGTIRGSGLICTTGSSSGCAIAVDNPPNSASYNTVGLSAQTDSSSVFKAWTGCTPLAENPEACTVYVNGPKTVGARFEPSTYPLTATFSGAGGGMVTGPGLSCASGSGSCTAAIGNPADTTSYQAVTLTALADGNSAFKGWTGCSADPANLAQCTVTVSRATTVTAKFEPASFPLTVAFSGTGGGSVTGPAVSCSTGSPCVASVANPQNSASYQTVTLTAAPDSASVFKGWVGCSVDPATPRVCSVLVSRAMTVTAKFEPSTIPLVAAFTGGGGGGIDGGGLSCTTAAGGACSAAVPNPSDSPAYTTVTLTAAPDGASAFKSWMGCSAVDGNPAQCTVTVSRATTVTARFEPATYPLTLAFSGGGSGQVSGAGVTCSPASGTCTVAVANPSNSATYAVVTINATADPGSVFKGWSGCVWDPATPEVCTVTVSRAVTVTARFEPSTYALTAARNGSGLGSVASTDGAIQCGGTGSTCTASFANGSDVTLVATPDTGSVFTAWVGCSPNADGSCTVTMTSARTVYATFQPSTYPIQASFTGTGSGTVSDGTASCASSSGGCALAEPYGSSVTLVATADPGFVFTGWSGICSGTDPCIVTMTATRYVRATFSQ